MPNDLELAKSWQFILAQSMGFSPWDLISWDGAPWDSVSRDTLPRL